MKLLNKTFKEIIQEETQLTFLIGAGCSVDAPSCLPAGRKMMDEIIKYICEGSEFEKAINVKDLRFEALVELVRDYLDNDLRVIDYYGICDKPNMQHFFLAEMIKKGHFVMTTNFDFLIEYALLQLGIVKEELKIVITKRAFEKHNNPTDLFNRGFKTLYKIHGSSKNVIKDKDTKDTLVATIQAFGSNKEGMNVFQVEPFKKELFENITKYRSLIVMGYSGSDDFDVVPTLKVLKNIKNLFWINFIPNDGGTEKIFQFEDSDTESMEDKEKVNQILAGISKMQNYQKIYRIDTNTTRLVNELIEVKPKLSKDNFSSSPIDWLIENIEAPNEIEKLYFPYRIYFDFDMYEEALRVNEKLLEKAKEMGSDYWIGTSLNNAALILQRKGQYEEALENFERSVDLAIKIDDKHQEAIRLSNLANLYRFVGRYEESIETYQKSLEIDRELNNKRGEAICLNNIGTFYYDIGRLSDAFEYFNQALKIYEELGDLNNRAKALKNIGDIYMRNQNFEEALKYNEHALKIAIQLASFAEITRYISGLGRVYFEQKDYEKALKNYEESLKNYKLLENRRGMATIYNNLGRLYKDTGDLEKAIKNYEIALQIDEELNNLSGKATRLNNIASLYYKQKNYSSALEYFKESYQINDQLGRLDAKANASNSMAIVNKALKNNSEVIKNYEKAIEIFKELGNLKKARQILSNLIHLLKTLEREEDRIPKLEDAIEMDDVLGNLGDKGDDLCIRTDFT